MKQKIPATIIYARFHILKLITLPQEQLTARKTSLLLHYEVIRDKKIIKIQPQLFAKHV